MKRRVGACWLTEIVALLAACAVCEAQQQPYTSGQTYGPDQPYGQGQAGASGSGFAPRPAFRSQQSYLDVLGGLAYTDNVRLTRGAKVGDGLGVVGVDLDYTRHGKLDLDARGAVDWVEYFKHEYPGTALGTLNATALWGQSTDILQWLAAETFGQANINPLAASVPTNIENINYFTTGPYVNVPLGLRDRLSFHGTYSNLMYERSPYGSNIFSGGLELSHLLSATSSIGLAGDDRHTELTGRRSFTGTTNQTYDVRSGYLRYTAAIGRTRASAAAGYTSLDFGSRKSSTPYLSLQLDRRISPDSTVYLRASNGYSSTGQSLRNGFGEQPGESSGGTGQGLGVATQNPFRERLVALGWQYNRDRTGLSLTATDISQRYESVTNFDQNHYILAADLERRMSPTLSANIALQADRLEYLSVGSRFTDLMGTASLTKRFRRANLILRYNRYQRSGNGVMPTAVPQPGQPLHLPVTSFNDNRIGAYLSYDVVGHRERYF